MLILTVVTMIVLVITLYRMPKFIIEQEIEIRNQAKRIDLQKKALRACKIRTVNLERDREAQTESFKAYAKE